MQKTEEIGGGLGTGLAGEGRFKFDFNSYFLDSYNSRITSEFFKRLNKQNPGSKTGIVGNHIVQDLEEDG